MQDIYIMLKCKWIHYVSFERKQVMAEMLCNGNNNKAYAVFRCYNGAASDPFVQSEPYSVTQRNRSFHSRASWCMGVHAQAWLHITPWEQSAGGWEGRRRGGFAHSPFYNHCERKQSSNTKPFHWASYLFNHFPPKCERTNPNSGIHTPETHFSSCSVHSETVILVQSLVDKHRISEVS